METRKRESADWWFFKMFVLPAIILAVVSHFTIEPWFKIGCFRERDAPQITASVTDVGRGLPVEFAKLSGGKYTVVSVVDDHFGELVVRMHLPTADLNMLVTDAPADARRVGYRFSVGA